MTAYAWSLFGLLAATLGILATALFSSLGSIDALRSHMDGRFAEIGAELRDVRYELRGLGADVAGLHSNVGDPRHDMQSLDRRLTSAGG